MFLILYSYNNLSLIVYYEVPAIEGQRNEVKRKFGKCAINLITL